MRQSSFSWSKVYADSPPSPPGCASVGQYRRYIHHPAEKRHRSVSRVSVSGSALQAGERRGAVRDAVSSSKDG